jgi:hypothetical protein
MKTLVRYISVGRVSVAASIVPASKMLFVHQCQASAIDSPLPDDLQ